MDADFWDIYTRDEIYMVRGRAVQLVDYLRSTAQAVFIDEDGQEIYAGRGLIRLVR